MYAVLGLGNPGPHYEGTRHNVGFCLVDRLAKLAKANWEHSSEQDSLVVRSRFFGSEVLLVKPLTYMNASGLVARRICAKEGYSPGQFLVVYDDFLLDFGRIRLRPRGSDGGHNGLASVLEMLCSKDVPRLRMGIGSPSQGGDVTEYVLGQFSRGDDVKILLDRGVAAFEVYIAEGIESAMNQFNGV